ncbi:hypothetical protein ACSBR2_008413 [Camellia fascicularis]
MPVAASAIYFLNLHGDVLINRLYCDDVGRYKEKKEEVAETEVDPERDQRMVNEAGQNESTFTLILISIIFSPSIGDPLTLCMLALQLPPEVSCFLGYSLWGYNVICDVPGLRCTPYNGPQFKSFQESWDHSILKWERQREACPNCISIHTAGPTLSMTCFECSFFNRTFIAYVSNITYLDSPSGVGFSYSANESDYVTGDLKTASDSHEFLLKWFALYLEFLSNPFFISGESCAGVYVPTLAYEVAKGIDAGVKPVLNFKGAMRDLSKKMHDFAPAPTEQLIILTAEPPSTLIDLLPFSSGDDNSALAPERVLLAIQLPQQRSVSSPL